MQSDIDTPCLVIHDSKLDNGSWQSDTDTPLAGIWKGLTAGLGVDRWAWRWEKKQLTQMQVEHNLCLSLGSRSGDVNMGINNHIELVRRLCFPTAQARPPEAKHCGGSPVTSAAFSRLHQNNPLNKFPAQMGRRRSELKKAKVATASECQENGTKRTQSSASLSLVYIFLDNVSLVYMIFPNSSMKQEVLSITRHILLVTITQSINIRYTKK